MTKDTKIIISAETARAEAAMRSLQDSVGGLSRKMFDLSSVATTLVGALSVTAFVGFIKSSIDAADELNNLSIKTGTSVEQLAGLKYAAEQSDTSLQSIAEAAKKLSSNMAEQPELFARFGLSAKDTTGALIQMADIFSAMPDGVEKTALAVKLMGKNGEEMIPFLNQGGKAIQSLVDQGAAFNPISTEMAERSNELNDNLNKFKAQAEGAALELTNVLIPGLLETSTAMNRLAQEGHPVLALFRGFAGLGKIPWDLIMPPENIGKSLSSASRLNELKSDLAEIENRLKTTGGREGIVGKWLHGSREDQEAQARILKNQIAALEKFGADIDKLGKPDAIVPDQADDGNGKRLFSALATSKKSKPPKLQDAMVKDYEKHQAGLFSEGKGMDEAASEAAAYEERLAAAQTYHELANTDAASYAMMREQIEADHQAKLLDLGRKGMLSRAQIDKLEATNKVKLFTGTLSNIIGAGAESSRALFNINKAASLANAAVTLPETVMDAYSKGTKIGGPPLGVVFGGLAFSAQMVQMNAIKSAQFGGGGGGAAPAGGGTVSSVALPGQIANPGQVAANTNQQQQQTAQPVQVNIYNSGNVLSADYVNDTIIPQIKDSISNSDVLIIDPRSRQAQVLGAA